MLNLAHNINICNPHMLLEISPNYTKTKNAKYIVYKYGTDLLMLYNIIINIYRNKSCKIKMQ